MKHANTTSSMNLPSIINLDDNIVQDELLVSEPHLELVNLLNPICKIKGELCLQKPSRSSLGNVISLAAEIRMYCVDRSIEPYNIPERYYEWLDELNELERIFLYRDLVLWDVSENFMQYN